MQRTCKNILFLAIACFLAAIPAPIRAGTETGLSGTPREIKAAFIYNFINFIHWPTRPIVEEKEILICVISKKTMIDSLSILNNKQIRDKAITVKPYSLTDTPDHCHLLYVPSTDPNLVEQVLQRVRNKPILTIGEAVTFPRSGGIIGFISSGRTIRFAINLEAARKAGITISSKLLSLATIIRNNDLP